MNPAETLPSGLFCALSARTLMSSVPRGALMRPLPVLKGVRQRVAELFFIPAKKNVLL